MERFLTVLAASLCAAPLFFIVTLRWILPALKGFSQNGTGMNLGASLLFGAGMAFFGFLLIGGLAWFFAGRGYLRPVQMGTGLMLAGWSLAGVLFVWQEPRSLDYVGQEAILEAEVRVNKSLLKDQPLHEAVALSYLGGDFDFFHLDKRREDGNFIILPWQTTVHTVYKWAIWATISQARAYFLLDLPYRPSQSTDWSDWAAPQPHEWATIPQGLTLRYRIRLVKKPFNDM